MVIRVRESGIVVQLIMLAYHANVPVLLVGRHGVGKSTLIELAAKMLDIGLSISDLSLMDPTDLAGMPCIKTKNNKKRMTIAVPEFLPDRGAGLICFEELNRCSPQVRAPCLQLLTLRALNDYKLPPAWLPVAAINPRDDGIDYEVDELDPALLSRFTHIWFEPDRLDWVKWANNGGDIHKSVSKFVELSPGVFDDSYASPRSWEFVSHKVKAAERLGSTRQLLCTSISGLVREHWALGFDQFYHNCPKPASADQIVERYPQHAARIARWCSETRLDIVIASLDSLKQYLTDGKFEAVMGNDQRRQNVRSFLSDLPADLQRQTRAWLKEQGFQTLTIPRKNNGA